MATYDTSGKVAQNGSTPTSASPTVATNGSLVLLLISSPTTGDNYGTPTCGGSNMTQIQAPGITGSGSGSGQRKVQLWYMENVASGSKTIAVTPSSITNRYSWSYAIFSGVATSSSLDTSAKGTTSTTTSVTGTLTLAQANELMIMVNFNAYNASTNSTFVPSSDTQDDAQMFYYNNVGPGSTSMTQSAGSAEMNYIAAAFFAAATGPTNVKTVDGVSAI